MMELLSNFLYAFGGYVQELWLTLAVGFFLSGVFYKAIPTDIVDRYLGQKGLKPIMISSIVGVILPVCCIGSLPIALTLKRKGASLGSVLAFLVATPATSITALIVCWKLLGAIFTATIFFAAIFIAIVLGVMVNNIKFDLPASSEKTTPSCCQHEASGTHEHSHSRKSFIQTMKEILHYGFVVLPREIGLEVIIGISIASFISVFPPVQEFIHHYLTGAIGYAFILVMGLVTYVCSTASVPMADALMHSGMSAGQALCYLLVGPITSYGTILVIKKDFGRRVLILYLANICFWALVLGLLFDILR